MKYLIVGETTQQTTDELLFKHMRECGEGKIDIYKFEGGKFICATIDRDWTKEEIKWREV